MKAMLAALLVAALAAPAAADIQITEWMYSGPAGEFIELTNVGNAAVDMTGWSFSDDGRTAGDFSLSGFGLVAPGESVVITEATAAAFRTAFNLGAEVKVLGELTTNLGRNDEINIYDATSTLVDRLDFGDQDFPGTVRAQDPSGNVPFSLLASQVVTVGMPLSAVGDSFGSVSTAGGVGNPGRYVIPEPASLALLVPAAMLLMRRRRA